MAIAQALAEAVEWDRAPSEQFSSFDTMCDAVIAHLQRYDGARDRGPNPKTEAELRAREVMKRGLSPEVLAAAHEAGVALGQKFTTYTGELAGSCPPAPSRRGKLLALAEQTANEVKRVG